LNKSDCKDIEDYLFQINAVLLNFAFAKNPQKYYNF